LTGFAAEVADAETSPSGLAALALAGMFAGYRFGKPKSEADERAPIPTRRGDQVTSH
jgi:hypothetical protein